MSNQTITSSPAVWQVPSENDWLVVMGEFPGNSQAALFDYWTQPDLLRRWWPQEAEMDLRVDGAYHLAWPGMGWHLRGHYTAIERGKSLAFTWKWDSAPELTPIRHVIVLFEKLAEGGTRLTITHGPYADTREDQEERAGHIEGWTHFLGKLHSLISGEHEDG